MLIDFQMPMMVTGLVLEVLDSPLEIPGMGPRPAGVHVKVEVDLFAAKTGGVACYVIRDAPPKEVLEEALKDNVTPFKVQ